MVEIKKPIIHTPTSDPAIYIKRSDQIPGPSHTLHIRKLSNKKKKKKKENVNQIFIHISPQIPFCFHVYGVFVFKIYMPFYSHSLSFLLQFLPRNFLFSPIFLPPFTFYFLQNQRNPNAFQVSTIDCLLVSSCWKFKNLFEI